LSSRIEGTHTSLEELYGFESGIQLPGFSLNDESRQENQEVNNYVKALKAGVEWIKNKPINLALIKEMNRILLYGVRGDADYNGEFRQIQNFIGRTNNPEEAIFMPPPVEELAGSLKKFENYLNVGNQYPPLLRIGLLHYQFETIHPFIDGNGRVGRLLTVLLFVSLGLLPSPLLYLSAFFEQYREQYFQELLKVSQKGTWEDWLTLFLNAIITQSKDAVRRSSGLIDLREGWRKKLNQFKSNSDLFQIVDSLFVKPYLSIKDVEKMLGVTNKSAALDVSKLQKIGILTLIEDKPYAKAYEAKAILGIIRAK
jgi:Fic family protein